MEITASKAAIFASRVLAVSAVIDDFAAKPPTLTIDGELDTSGADSVRFLRESPLVNGPGAFTRAVSIEGPGKLKLNMVYPLWGTDPVRVAGDYTFAGATATVAKSLAMRDGVVLTQIEGKADASALAAYAPDTVVARLAGGMDWKARVLSGAKGTDLVVTSDLKGLASTLPDPFAKASGDARAMTITMARLGTDSEVTTMSLGEAIQGRFNRSGAPGAEHWNALLKFGGPLSNEPWREGLWLYGELPSLDIDAWQDVFAAPRASAPAAAPGIELRGVELSMGTARYLARDFHRMHARLERNATQWSGKLESPLLAGDVRSDLERQGRLTPPLHPPSIA